MAIHRFIGVIIAAFFLPKCVVTISAPEQFFSATRQLYALVAAPVRYAQLHQNELIMSAFGGTLAYFFCRTIYLHAYLQRPDLWSLWQIDGIHKDLLRAIQVRYDDRYETRDTLGKLGACVSDIEREIGALQEYRSLIFMIKRLHLASLLHTLIDEELLFHTSERLAQLFELKRRCQVTFLEGMLS